MWLLELQHQLRRSNCGLDERLPSLDSPAGQQPVAMGLLAVSDQEQPPGRGQAHGDTDARLHGGDYRSNLDGEQVFALGWVAMGTDVLGTPR